MTKNVTYLKNYQPFNFQVENINLSVDLYEEFADVVNTMHLKRESEGDLILFGDGLELIKVSLNDVDLNATDYQIKDGNLILSQVLEKAKLTLVTRIYPQKNTALSGLYKSKNLFCTQCEAEGFRRITFYPDRPDVLSKFTTRISADKALYPILLSNGNLMDSGETKDGRHWVIWEDPFKKPAYLFALVAGNLECLADNFTTASGRNVALKIYVEPGNVEASKHAMASLKHSMVWDEKVYGREYDLDIFMIVAVSAFNMGAMENKGLNIFNDKYILAKPETATDNDFADIEGVIAHEYFHNWTGNRVTCRDWFQLSLKEGLTVFRDQEFSRDMNSRDVNRINDVKLLRTVQFPEDSGKMAHPVRPESYQEINNFYTATIYNKGAEVIRMQHTLLGKAGFRKGMDLYFDRHDGKAVTIDDFVAAMEDANGKDLTQFKLWYSQAGTPRIEAESHFKDNTLTIKLTQTCPATPEKATKEPFHIPISLALFNQDGHQLPLDQTVLELKEKEQTFSFPGLSAKPIVSLLRDFSAPVILDQNLSDADLLSLLRFETNGLAKWDAGRCLMRRCIKDWMNNSENLWKIPAATLAAFREILLDSRLDMDLRAELLTPLEFEEVVGDEININVTQIEQLRDHYRKQLGSYLYEELRHLYQILWDEEDHTINAKAFGRRKLRNICLYYLMKTKESESLTLCQLQFEKAKTMTDQLSSLKLLANAQEDKISQKCINDFYKQWSNNDLVIDKWFIVQATCEKENTLEQVKALLKHPAFSWTNPNRVRSLLGAFCQNNRNFHAADGSGYAFLSEMLQKMDPINPQISAKLATPFTRWQRLDKSRQDKIIQHLEHLKSQNLSEDLRELVEKSLLA